MQTVIGTLGILFALLLAASPPLSAMPRLMTDEEMDRVSARGSQGFDTQLVTIREMVFQFYSANSVAQVSGSGLLRFEANTTDPRQVEILIGSQQIVSEAAPAEIVDLLRLEPIEIRAIDATVRVTGQMDISINLLPRSNQALGRNGLLIRQGWISGDLAVGHRPGSGRGH